jgi:predicted Zn-dependent protease with MMP-like domain
MEQGRKQMDPLFLILAVVLIASLLWRLLPREKQPDDQEEEWDLVVPPPTTPPSQDRGETWYVGEVIPEAKEAIDRTAEQHEESLGMPDDSDFAEQVRLALLSLPEEFAEKMENIEILIEPRPRSEHRRAVGLKPWQTLYGLYQGVPLPRRRVSYGLVAPDVITIFSEPLQRDFRSPERLRRQIRRTVLHEIAHHFGISDERLIELDAY